MGEIERLDNIGQCEIYVCDGFQQVKDKMVEMIDAGLVSILYDVKLKEYCDNFARSFRGGNQVIFATCLESEIPDHTRFIIGIGTGTIADKVRRKASTLDIDCALVFSAPTTDTILTPTTHPTNFKAAFLDRTLIDTCPRECVASGWGIVLAEPLTNFEKYYNEKVLDKKSTTDKYDTLSIENNNINLAYRLLQMSLCHCDTDNATIMAKVLYDGARRQGTHPRLVGEYKFISASVISTLYESYLSSPTIDCGIPPAHDINLETLTKLTGRSKNNLLKAFDFFDIDGYFRVGYILSEYRLDLLDKLRTVDFHSAQKRWRRLYADAGYWLKSAFSSNSLLTAMRLSAEIGNGLLRYIAESGFVEICQ